MGTIMLSLEGGCRIEHRYLGGSGVKNGSHHKEIESEQGIVHVDNRNIKVVDCCYGFEMVVIVDLTL